DRATAVCQFCDTDFWGTDGQNGGRYSAAELADLVASLWPDQQRGLPYVVCTGGEPLLQLDEPLIKALQAQGFEVAVETNGTLPAPAGLDWICVSPKAGSEIVQRQGHELKLVYPQSGAEPERYTDWDFRHFYLQPMDSPQQAANIQATLSYCLTHPQWRLSLQTHKIVGID
ncbi:MAG: 7-carboxy-7-deazaguanine synthase, partial [Lewinella sp.]|nr:7-carboxy-7-deazaguanine synthase [Lewinella sp.]